MAELSAYRAYRAHRAKPVRPMLKSALRRLLLLSALVSFAACSTVPRYEAANDIHAFLVSIRDGDRMAFDQHVDKSALKEQLRSRLLAEGASANGASAIGAFLAGPLIDLGVDTLVRPDVFRAVAIEVGYAPDRPIPSVLAIGQFVRPLDGRRACVFTRNGGPCVLMFKNEDGVWKLIGFEGRIDFGKSGKLRLGP